MHFLPSIHPPLLANFQPSPEQLLLLLPFPSSYRTPHYIFIVIPTHRIQHKSILHPLGFPPWLPRLLVYLAEAVRLRRHCAVHEVCSDRACGAERGVRDCAVTPTIGLLDEASVVADPCELGDGGAERRNGVVCVPTSHGTCMSSTYEHRSFAKGMKHEARRLTRG
jgi:hypothetical protein